MKPSCVQVNSWKRSRNHATKLREERLQSQRFPQFRSGLHSRLLYERDRFRDLSPPIPFDHLPTVRSAVAIRVSIDPY